MSRENDIRLCSYFMFIKKLLTLLKEVLMRKLLKKKNKKLVKSIKKSKNLINNCKFVNKKKFKEDKTKSKNL